jgi:Holliday junction resolvase
VANKNYQQGYRFEKIEQKYWEDRGYYVCRAYGSKGDFDLIAFNSKEVVAISVKSFRTKRGSYKADSVRLSNLTKSPGLRRIRAEHGPIVRGVKTPRREIEV